VRNLTGVQLLNLQVMFPRSTQYSADQFTLWRTYLQNAGLVKQPLITASLQLLPQEIGPLQQRHIVRMFKVGLTYDPGFTVGAAAIVRNRILVDAQHPVTRCGQVVEGCATDTAAANNYDIVAGHVSFS
jgi:hypothetical protein